MSATENSRATPHRRAHRPRPHGRSAGHLAGIAATVAAGVAVTSGGVYAALTADALNGVAQTVSSGTLLLNLDSSTGSTGFSAIVDKLAPGDVVNRYVALRNTGSLNGQALSLKLSDSSATALTTDATRGLQVTVKECPVAWTVATGTCTAAGTPTTGTSALAPVPAATLRTATTPPALVASGLTALTGVRYYQVSLSLPDATNVESSVNGTLPTPVGGSIQGLAANLTWTFTMAQRTATTTNG